MLTDSLFDLFFIDCFSYNELVVLFSVIHFWINIIVLGMLFFFLLIISFNYYFYIGVPLRSLASIIGTIGVQPLQ